MAAVLPCGGGGRRLQADVLWRRRQREFILIRENGDGAEGT